jgi:hypothetical protein
LASVFARDNTDTEKIRDSHDNYEARRMIRVSHDWRRPANARRLSDARFIANIVRNAVRRVVMRTIVFGAALAAVILIAPSPGSAAERNAKPAGVLPPFEILTVVRSAGLNPVGRPTRRGPNYMLRAVDEFGQDVRVVVDGRMGEVISVTPVGYEPRELGREADPMFPSIYQSGTPVYEGRPRVYGAPPAVVIEEDEPPVYRGAAPLAPPTVAAPPEREVVVVPPPAPPAEASLMPSPPPLFPFPRPPGIVPVPEPQAVPPESEGEESALLPPPPPRFPQRAPPPSAKPAQKAGKSAAKSSATKSSANKSKPATPANSQSAPPPAQLPN